MKIELLIEEGVELLLSPVKKDKNGSDHHYLLIDDNNKSWMELELSNNSFKVVSKDEQVKEEDHSLTIKLDQLVLNVIEAEQSGTENTETKEGEDASPYDPDKIKVHSKQFSIKLIEEMIDNGDIDFTPDFQRKFVWNSLQKSRLIESILLRIPLPMFYFAEDDEGKVSVVDGLQRLTTIKEFMENKFPLKNLEYLKDSCEGKYYSSRNKDGSSNGKNAIDPKYFRWFNMTQFSVNVIDPTSPAKVKYDIFRRINTGGKPLNNQEIRNCLAGKGLREVLTAMANLQEFKLATDYSIRPTRMDDQELALRFILFYRLKEKHNSISDYSGYMDSSLDDLTEEFAKSKKEELEIYLHLFSNSMKNAKFLFGQKYAFRKVVPVDLEPRSYKQLINKALFVCLSVLLADFSHERIVGLNSEMVLLAPLANRINEDDTLWHYLSYGTNGKANLLYAFKEVEKIIEHHLQY